MSAIMFTKLLRTRRRDVPAAFRGTCSHTVVRLLERQRASYAASRAC